MNRTEAEYAGMLDLRMRAGDIVWWRFEAIKIRLADNTFYTPDFLVLLSDMRLECHEVKGAFVMDDAKVKLKVAAETCPFGLVLAQKVSKTWHVEVLS
jgi:hypothetical protein